MNVSPLTVTPDPAVSYPTAITGASITQVLAPATPRTGASIRYRVDGGRRRIRRPFAGSVAALDVVEHYRWNGHELAFRPMEVRFTDVAGGDRIESFVPVDARTYDLLAQRMTSLR